MVSPETPERFPRRPADLLRPTAAIDCKPISRGSDKPVCGHSRKRGMQLRDVGLGRVELQAMHTANKWWQRAEANAGLAHVSWAGFHSARTKFASELKATNLRDLAYMGGWTNPETVLRVYQQPEMEIQRQALATRKKVTAAG